MKRSEVYKPSAEVRHPFGELLTQYRLRKSGLTQTRMAELAGYDHSIVVRICQGKKDLTGPSGRERVVRLIETLADQACITTLDEADALLLAANLPPLFARQPAEAKLISRLSRQPAGHRNRRTNLPAPLTSFVNRALEIAEVRQLLCTTRLLTLTGAGGSGKTRLAQRVAADTLIVYSEGVWYAELATLTEAGLIPGAVARALGLIAADRPVLEHIQDYLRERHMLLVLDNCEHLIDAVAAFVIEVLRACPRVTVLATSREALNVDGETAWRVPAMQPDEAARLFVERAAAARHDIAIGTHDPIIRNICQRLDGMPLAIELAAARLSALTLGEIEARLTNRLSLLVTGRRGTMPRHKTLRALIDWSHDLLSEPEKVLFRRLGVFVGGWNIDDAQRIVYDQQLPPGAIITHMSQLAAKSLVSVSERNGTTRYHLLETLREYALEKLSACGELLRMQKRHIAAYAVLAEDAEPHIHDESQRYWVPRLESEHDNIRAALAWSLSTSGDIELGLHLVCRMWHFWWVGYIVEGTSWLKRFVDAAPPHAPVFALGRIWLGYGSLLLATAKADVIKATLEEAIRLLLSVNDNEGVSFALYLLGCIRELQSDERIRLLLQKGWSLERWKGNRLNMEWAVYMCARHSYWIDNDPQLTQRMAVAQDAAAFSLARGDLQTFALASFDMALVEFHRMNLAAARDHAERAIEAAQKVGACWEESAATSVLSKILQINGDAELAQQHITQWFDLAERFGWPSSFYEGPYYVLGRLARDRQDYSAAQQFFLKSIVAAFDFRSSVSGLEGLSCIAQAQGDPVFAAKLLGLSKSMRADNPWWQVDLADFGPFHARARATLGDAAYETAFAEGTALTIPQVIEHANSSPLGSH